MSVKHGEINCQSIYSSGNNKGQQCKNGAYYSVTENNEIKYLCGIHSREKVKVELEKVSSTEKAAIKEDDYNKRLIVINQVASKNAEEKRGGYIVLFKMGMMKTIDYIPGVLSIFPNFKHGNRKDGYGCSRLSPMSLGPVEHGQPNLPPSKNLENFHQFSKKFACESDEQFKITRLNAYNDPVPHRHKFEKMIPEYFVWVDKTGKEHHLDYISSRQFYCNFYERLVKKEDQFLYLKQLISMGYNLQICGYDAYDIPFSELDGRNIVTDVEKCYLDKSAPFGHERVLYSMLYLNEKDYPWVKYKTFDF